MGSLPKKIKGEDKRALSTPQSAPHSSKMCAPKIGTLENNTTTPTLPQGAAAERQHHLQKKDVRQLPYFPSELNEFSRFESCRNLLC